MGDLYPRSPLGATPRPHLRQVYPEAEEYSHVTVTSKSNYTVLRSPEPSMDEVDAADSASIGSSTKSVCVLATIFFLSLLVVACLYASLNSKKQE